LEVSQLPGYELGEAIHDSNAAVVYRATRLSDGAGVVIKRSQGNSVSVRQLTRYRNEYELLRSIDCRGVVKAYDLLRHDGHVALVLEDLPGTSLRAWIDSAPDAPIRERLAIAIQLAEIVGSVHAASVIHKDVSSHNVVYDPAGRSCTLIDFGIATRLRTEESKFTAAAALEGTLAYIAPEQTGRMNRNLDYRADLYSLGVTLYELFTGELPHKTADQLEMVHFHIAGKPVPPRDRHPRVPDSLSDIVMKLLQKEPEDRYQSAAGLVADLRRCLAAIDAGRPGDRFALGGADVVDRFDPPQKLYGRAAEIGTLLASFERVARGGVETVTVAGQPGIGKTSLVQEIYQPITRQRGYFVSGKFDLLQQNVPFSALVTALQDLVQQLLTEGEEEIAAWREAIDAAVHPNGQLIVDVVPALELIIGPQQRVPELEALEAQNRFHLAFQNFVQLFCRKSHPLVLFLDDMQWADSASLNLITRIVSARATESLLLVLTYRHSEVEVNHPFLLAVREQRKQGVPVQQIELAPLGVRDVAEFVADTLHHDAATATPLAQIIQQKTGGNPFFMRQFMRALYGARLITFDRATKRFRYDVAAVKSAAITENVAELLATELERLPESTRATLRVAAVIGSRFDLRLLANVQQQSAAATNESLRPAVEAGLVVPLTGLESVDVNALQSPLVYGRFAFRHDRVQQAAYAALPERERPGLHLAIGRAWLAMMPAAELEARLFDIVGHLNEGRGSIDDVAERRRLADLNRRAGIKARDATAYDLAVSSFRIAIELDGAAAWRDRYEVQFDTHRRLAEALGLTADAAGALAVIEHAAGHAASLIDRTQLSAIKTNVLLIMGRIPEALACGRAAAREFGVDLPEQPEEVRALLQREIGSIRERAAAAGIEKLLDQPAMEDPSQIALMGLLMHCLPAAFQTDQESYALLCCTMVRLSLEHGNCPLSARAYGSFAALLSSQLSEYEEAYRFAKLGVDLAHKLGETSVLSGVYFLWAMFASHWVKPVDESIDLYEQAVRFGLESGDHVHAGYSVARRFSHLQVRGAPLAELRDEGRAALETLHRISDAANREFLQPRLELIDWLRGERRHGNTLGTAELDEAARTAVIQARGNRSFEADWFMILTILRFHAEDFAAAHAFAEMAAGLQPFCAGFVTRAEHALFHALATAAVYPAADPDARGGYDAKLAAIREQMRRWVTLCAENIEHMQLLVEAECARLRDARIEAADFYDRAIAAARSNGYLGIEALAAELAGRFWLAAGKPDFGRIYLDKALDAYVAWGAAGKAADLSAKHGLVPAVGAAHSSTSSSTTLGPSSGRRDALDLATLLKASQAIAGEIVLERLLVELMDIIRENAGAESVVIVLESNGEFLVQAVKTASDVARVLVAEPLRLSVACSTGIVNYVLRTSELVVLDDAAQQGKYRSDAYVASRRPKSILCAPVAHKGKLIGALYLENNQVAGAFTPDRLEALNILMSQMAVSIENATLYARQEQQSRAIEAANVKLTTEIAERKRAEGELSRYKDHLEDLVKERTRELEKANEQIRALAYQDGLTGLPNRRLFNEHLGKVLARSRRKGTEFAVLFIDIDNFKLINDTIGHQAADEVLRDLATSLGMLIRTDDMLDLYQDCNADSTATISLEPMSDAVLSRLGGDEFIVMLPDTRDRFAAGTVAQRILTHFEQPISVDGHEVFITVSIGIATYPEDGLTSEILVRNADTAMYHAKQQGKAAFQYYSAAMNAASVERLALETGLRHALEDGSLELHYQPQVEVRTGTIIGAEALLRWKHPQRGQISPASFIPIAEASGLIVPIGEWVLERACAQAAEWREAGLPRIPISVNVSGVQFHRQDLCDVVRKKLDAFGLDPSILHIEITETAIVAARERAIELLTQLRRLGVRLALDDFGTGYSSLSYLKNFPIDTVKIDRSFVAEMLTDHTTASIVEAIVSMSRILGLSVVAEGVEDPSQFAFLQRIGCDAVQGFYVSAALPAAQFVKLLEQRDRKARLRRGRAVAGSAD
jgi:predicted ATPase/predicted signal transduction protein with EAL and GGDEF domain/tRNA A-37 threonylcarbamoyl transferase component Bud32